VENLAKRGGPYLTWNCALLQKGKQPLTALLVPVHFTVYNLNEAGWEVGEKFDILIY
jgi:hypothetical protein